MCTEPTPSNVNTTKGETHKGRHPLHPSEVKQHTMLPCHHQKCLGKTTSNPIGSAPHIAMSVSCYTQRQTPSNHCFTQPRMCWWPNCVIFPHHARSHHCQCFALSIVNNIIMYISLAPQIVSYWLASWFLHSC